MDFSFNSIVGYLLIYHDPLLDRFDNLSIMEAVGNLNACFGSQLIADTNLCRPLCEKKRLKSS